MVLDNPELPYNGFLSQVIDRYEIVDDTTMELWTKRSEPRLSYTLGVTVWGDSFYIIPKHIFENEDPNTFMFYPPRYQRPVQAQ